MQVRGMSPISYTRANHHQMAFSNSSIQYSSPAIIRPSPQRPPNYSQNNSIAMVRTPDRPLARSNLSFHSNAEKSNLVNPSPKFRNHVLSTSNQIIPTKSDQEESLCLELSSKIKELEETLNRNNNDRISKNRDPQLSSKKKFDSKAKEIEYKEAFEELEKKVESLLLENEKYKAKDHEIRDLRKEISNLNNRLISKENEIQNIISMNSKRQFTETDNKGYLEEITNLESKIEELLEENEQVNLILRDKNFEVEELTLALQNRNEVEFRIQELENENIQLRSTKILNPELEIKIEALMNENTSMSDLISEKVKELEKFQMQIKSLTNENNNLKDLNSTLKKLNEEYQQKLNKFPECKHHDYDENIQMLKDYEIKFQTIFEENDKMNDFIGQLEIKNNELTLALNNYNHNVLKELNFKLENALNQNTKLNNVIDTKDEECKRLFEIKKALELEFNELQIKSKSEINNQNQIVKTQQERLYFLDQELNHLKKKLSTFEQEKLQKNSSNSYIELEKRLSKITNESLEMIAYQKSIESKCNELENQNTSLKKELEISNQKHEKNYSGVQTQSNLEEKENIKLQTNTNNQTLNLQIEHWKCMYEQQKSEFYKILHLINAKKNQFSIESPKSYENEFQSLSLECEELRNGLENCAAAYEEAVSELNERRNEVEELNGKYCEAMALISEMERRFMGEE